MFLLRVFGFVLWSAVFICWGILSYLGDVIPKAYKLIWGHKGSDLPNSAFDTEADLKKKGSLKPGGFLLGVTESGKHIYGHHEASAIMFGGRGSGKTQTLIANLRSLKRRKKIPHVFVADPAGDIEKATRKELETQGCRCLVLDLENPSQSVKYNPISIINFQSQYGMPRDVHLLVQAMMPDSGRMNDAGIHFLESARSMLQSMLIADRGQRSIFDIVARLSVEKAERTTEFDKMRKASAFGGHILVKAGIEAFHGAGERERGSMDSTMSRHLRVWLDSAVQEITTVRPGDQELNLVDVLSSTQPTIVYIRTGLKNLGSYGGPFIRTVMSNVINALQAMWDKHQAPIPNGVWLMVDEAAAMGNCTAVVDGIRELRKAGLSVVLGFLSEADVRSTYGDTTNLMKLCDWVVNGGAMDIPLYEQIVKLAGARTVKRKSYVSGDRKSETEHESESPLVTVHYMHALPEDECVVVARGILAKPKKAFVIKSGVAYSR